MTPISPAARECADQIRQTGLVISDDVYWELEGRSRFAQLIQQALTAESQKAVAERDALKALLREASSSRRLLENNR